LFLTFGFAVMIAQLVNYQVIQHAKLKEKAEEQRLRETTEPSRRGYIADAGGRVLAVNTYRWEISASPTVILADTHWLAVKLAPLLGMDEQDLERTLSNKKLRWVQLARDVPYPIGEQISSWHLSGVIAEPRPMRQYPAGDLAAQVTGFVAQTGTGYYGVEGYYDYELRGTTGTLQIEIDGMGRRIPIPPSVVRQTHDGASLVLTLDLAIQQIAQQELLRALRQSGAKRGTVIVMDPTTGALLALVSWPAYDPNRYATTEPSIMPDPAVSDAWEPGSIFKIVTWAAGLDTGSIAPDTGFSDPGKVEIGGRVIENSDRRAHGTVTMNDALAKSLNTAAAYISTSLGKDRFYNYVRRFGIGDLTGVDLANEGIGLVRLPGDQDWFPSDLGTNSFGQGLAVTPIQMITAVAAVANQGQLMRPYIVQKRIMASQPAEPLQEIVTQPEVVRQAISPEAAQTLTSMLVNAVEQQESEARVPGYRIAGKTGTAQIPNAAGYEKEDTIVSFVGFAPADDPRFIVLVKLDRPQKSRWAGQTAAPTFRAIATWLFQYMRIPPDEIRLASR
jgi:cell division protein FtsI/penicillin-binding protein 2